MIRPFAYLMRSSTLLLLAGPGLLAACQRPADLPAPAPELPYRAESPDLSLPEQELRRDRGTGILYLTEGPDLRAPRSDTLAIHRAPDPSSELRAQFVFDQPQMHGYSYQVLSNRPGLVSNVLEFGYEESGLPFDSLHPGGWARVIYALDAAGEPQKGWVELRSGELSQLLWREHLQEQSLYLLSPEAEPFHAAPGGEPLAIPLAPQGDYELIPVRVQGEWMQVRVVMPTACVAEPGEEPAERLAWIRYLHPDGRPRVWYYTRGC